MIWREHDEDMDCWCEPYLEYEDEDSRVIVHNHWVNGVVVND